MNASRMGEAEMVPPIPAATWAKNREGAKTTPRMVAMPKRANTLMPGRWRTALAPMTAPNMITTVSELMARGASPRSTLPRARSARGIEMQTEVEIIGDEI